MNRATEVEKTVRLNRARDLLRHEPGLSAAVARLAQDCAISPRQAYRYLQQAERLARPVPVAEAKQAFTVKLPGSLIRRVRLYATATGTSISEVVGRALVALLHRGRPRG
jgi:predicted DNA-binding transcriptional regulator YafY